MNASSRYLSALLFLFLAFSLPALAAQEGVVEHWGELIIRFREPVVSRTVVENASRRLQLKELEASALAGGRQDNVAPAPGDEDCGLTLFSVEGNPAPLLRWVDQNKLRIDFAPGSSPETLYRLSFKPGITYLSGAPLETRSFSFRCKPAGLQASWLREHAGGAALLSSLGSNTREAQAIAERHEGLRVCFRRMRHIPLVGWVCTGTVSARLRPAALADGLGYHRQVFDALLRRVKPEEVREGTPLPQCLVAEPAQPLQAGARYELGVEAAPGSGFVGGNLDLGFMSDGLYATLKREPVVEGAGEGDPRTTRLKLSFSHPVPEDALRALWGRLGVSVNGSPAGQQADGSFRAEVEGQPAVLRLRGLVPCTKNSVHRYWQEGREYHYAPAGCAQGLELEVDTAQTLELALSLPAGVQTRHGLSLAEGCTLRVSVSPAQPVLVGNGCNTIALSGQHRLRLPFINVGEVSATAWHWEAESAARLLPVLQHGMRDDTLFRELYQRLACLRRRAGEGIDTSGFLGDDARTEAGRALRLLQREREKTDPLREQALAAATACAPQPLALIPAPGSNGLVARGEAELDLDQLTGGQCRPGLYLISLSCRPGAEVVKALMAYGMKEEEAALPCTVDYLVQVTDMSLRLGRTRLLVNSLTTGEPLEGGQVTAWQLPQDSFDADDGEKQLSAAREEARPHASLPPCPIRQGEACLPYEVDGGLLLVQRGEDYAFFSLRDKGFPATHAPAVHKPMARLFCDRPMYRPGETAHLRGVLRCATKGGPALPRAKQGTLTIRKPNGDVLETRRVELDAFGAFAADVCLPAGEEDVTGSYRCQWQAEEGGQQVEASLSLSCQVFRRNAFEVELRAELDSVAPSQYRVEVQATDYNGSPVAGGKVALVLESDVGLLDEQGKPAAGVESEAAQDWQRLRRELVLDAGGKAVFTGGLASSLVEGRLMVNASVSNDREEHVNAGAVHRIIAPADFLIRMENNRRILLYDAHKGEELQPLARAQEIELTIEKEQEVRGELPSGIWYTERKPCTLARHRICVPANCSQGVDLSPWLPDSDSSLLLHIEGTDAEGRRIRFKTTHYRYAHREEGVCSLKPEGRCVRLETSEAFERTGQLHAFISSQGRLRHTLVGVEAGAKSVAIPLSEQEYGEVRVTLISCGKGPWGLCTEWRERSARCELPRPDKELRVEFSLPSGARPGDKVVLQGRVLGADGQPVRAAVTLFAVDEGMMSLSWYELPRLATLFYRGEAHAFTLTEAGRLSAPCRPPLRLLPDVWSSYSGLYGGLPGAMARSVLPARLDVGSFERGGVGWMFRRQMDDVMRAAQPNFHWSDLLLGGQQQMQWEAAPAPSPTVVLSEEDEERPAGLRSGSGRLFKAAGNSYRARALAEVDSAWDAGEEEEGLAPEPRLRTNFEPVALWLASLETGEDGSFCAECQLPDTLTTYRVYAVALEAGGSCFGQAQGEFLVNQELMLTAGTPFFMSTGDRLLLPLTITNNRAEAGEWQVTLEGAGAPQEQQVALDAGGSATLSFEVRAGDEGECVLRWAARSSASADAVEGRFPLRYPAPLLKEAHRLVLAEGGELVDAAQLLAPEVATATRGEVVVEYSTSPLIHLAGCMDFLLQYPYGCTEQRASALMPWLLHEHLAPFCPQMAQTPVAEVKDIIRKTISQLLARQQEDGGLSYWAAGKDEAAVSSPWASAYAALVLTIAQEQGHEVEPSALERLRRYLGRQNWHRRSFGSYQTQYAAARAQGKSGEVNRILVKALRRELEEAEAGTMGRDTADLEFMASLSSNPAGRHEALLEWLRSKGRDYRHRTSWSGGWTLIALSEYLRQEPRSTGNATLSINGEECPVESRPARLCLSTRQGRPLRELVPTLAAGKGTCYVSVKLRAQPEQTDYPGVTEKGLQVTRVYEVKDADGQWRQTQDVKVGDVVRVTLTCAKMADKLEYFVLEDYLPACMEAINPNVPSQAVGLEDGGCGSWSRWFDHKEYLADRVRGFCTRWEGRDVVNMSYYARVKRAGESAAPPAEAQLMYEPQTYGLSPNARVRSR